MPGGYTLKRVPTLSVVKAKKLECGKDSDHAGEQKHRSRWGVGFLQSDQFYSAFVSTTLVYRSQRKKGSGIEKVCQMDILLRRAPTISVAKAKKPEVRKKL